MNIPERALQPDDRGTWSSHEAALINDALDRKRAEFVSGAMSGDRAKAETAAELLEDHGYIKALVVELLMLANVDENTPPNVIIHRLFAIRRAAGTRLTNLAADHFDEADVIAEMIEAGELDEAE